MNGIVLDLFAGPGGWSEGLRMLGLTDVGIEWDDAACRTRAAAGHHTIRADIAAYPTAPFAGKVWGLIASPPCQDFSVAGKRAGIDGERGQLVTEVLRWAGELRPEWVACEQVPPVLPIWQEYAATLRAWGYSTWAGILNAADYGVPQTRKRAFLLASRVRPALPPEPTHARTPEPGLFGTLRPWVSMDACFPRRRGTVIRHNSAQHDRPYAADGSQPCYAEDGSDYFYRMPAGAPCWTLTAKCLDWKWETPDGDEPVRLAEALTLQSFPPNYPVSGGRTKAGLQIGNAVPPLLAAHVVSAVTGVPFEQEAAA